jgi:hypothetical protein
MTVPTDERYHRTARGRAEMRVRRHVLTREARNLLRIISATSTGAHWIAMVGCAPSELQRLLDDGLVMPARMSVEEALRRPFA